MNLKIKICLVIVALIIVFIIGVIIGQREINKYANTIVLIDTIYDTRRLDSIEYNIIKRDTIIYNIKQEMKDEIDKSFQLSNNDAVELFDSLCRQR